MQHDDEIKICGRHEKKVPLIWTFKFPGAEYWCPYCGYTSGMLGAGINVKIPGTDLLQQKQYWEEKSKKYLSGEAKKWKYEYKEGEDEE